MGGHSLAVADIDADGRDEIVYQAMTVDDDGKGLYSTGRRHGDSIQVGDFDPRNPGLETYLVTENEDDTVSLRTPGAGMHDSRTGKSLWSHSPGVDISVGAVADIDPRHAGCEVWGHGPLRTARGEAIGDPPRMGDWVIWWDGDLLREIYGRFPYRPNRLDQGFGFEDWAWNCETIAAGLKHRAVPETTHFIRSKPADSLREQTVARGCLRSKTDLFVWPSQPRTVDAAEL